MMHSNRASIDHHAPLPTGVESDGSQSVDTADEAMGALRDVGPWFASFLLHLGIIVLALALVWSLMMDEADPASKTPAQVSFTSHSASALEQVSQIAFNTTSREMRQPESEKIVTETDPQPIDKQIQNLIGPIGGAASANPLGDKTQTGGTGGDLFSPGPIGEPAGRIVYVLDASGSLTGELDYVVKELKRSLRQLSPEQRFAVLFFQRGRVIEAHPAGMKLATMENVRNIQEWVSPEAGNIFAGGNTNPLSALRVAMKYKPDLIYLLSDNITGRGEYEINQNDLLSELDGLNADRKTRISTIQFLYPDSLDTLRKIAAEHGGTSRMVTEQDIYGR